MRARHALASIVVAAALVTPAAAEPVAKVFPLAANGVPQTRADSLTRSLATALHADIATVPIEDAAGLLDCDVAADPCLVAVLKSVGADRLVFGVVSRGGASTKVTLTRFDVRGDRQQRTFDLVATTDDALGQELVGTSGPLFGLPEKKPAPPVTSSTTTPPTSGALPAPAPPPPRGSIKATTWLLLGTGAAATTAGVAFLISARGLRDDVEHAPMNTVADFERLVDLENKGTLHTRLGEGFAIGGGALLAIGIWRVFADRSSSVRVEPAPTRGGMAVTFTLELP